MYDTGGHDILTISDICNVAMLYVQRHPMILPDSVFMRVNVLTDVAKCFATSVISVSQSDLLSGKQRMIAHTGCGPLVIYPLPWGWQGPEVLIGIKDDYNEYDIDALFEKIVLKGCDRE
jgi:hypothetical protein